MELNGHLAEYAKAIKTDNNGTLKVNETTQLKRTPILSGFTRQSVNEIFPYISDKDGTLYGYRRVSNRRLAMSTDGGITSESTGFTFDEKIMGIVVSENNIIVSTWDSTISNIGKIYVGSKANGVAGPFELKITMVDGVYAMPFGMHAHYDGTRDIVLINEYGRKTVPNNARRTYLSTDGGNTFNVIRTDDELNDIHTHAYVYDPYSARIWVSVGDNPQTKTGCIYFSEDMGATWELAHPTDGQTDLTNATIIIPTPKYVLFGTDTLGVASVYR